MIETVVALYVDRAGPYPRIVRRWYDETRDARLYEGPYPVVAHPPCGPWGQLHHFSKQQYQKDLAPHAVELVRRFGGILEHPRGSKLWRACNLPLPRQGVDSFGGWSYAVNQVAYGHPCVKPTWLYLVGVETLFEIRQGGEPTHQIFGSHQSGHGHRTDLRAAHKVMRRRTPFAFALWLVQHAAQAVKR